MNQSNHLAKVNINELSTKMKSKKELYQFLVQDCQAFLPPLQSTNIYFFKQIMRGEKEVSDTKLPNQHIQYIRRDNVLVSAVPHIEGLTVENLLETFSGSQDLLKYIPDERDWVHVDRKWLCDVLYTLDKVNFQNQINAALQRRKDRLDQTKHQLVDMRPEFAQALSACLNFSSQHGRSSNLLKASSKRKRTKAELEEVKGEEEELRTDKQLFLHQVKRLKEEKAMLEEMVNEFKPMSIGLPSQLPSPSPHRPQQPFDI